MSRVRGLVLDASAWINILGTGCAERVLGCIPAECVVVDLATNEILRHPLGAVPKHPLEPLIHSGLVQKRSLDAAGLATFMSLVGADPPDDLGDGEAATIAFAHHFDFTAVLDERKARRVALERYAGIEMQSTVEVLRSEAVVRALGDDLPGAIYSALSTARMRVLAADAPWVLDCVGIERARACPTTHRWLRKHDR